MKRASQLRKHARTANAVLALLDAACRQRDLGRRATMRLLARDAIALGRYFDRDKPRQLKLPL